MWFMGLALGWRTNLMHVATASLSCSSGNPCHSRTGPQETSRGQTAKNLGKLASVHRIVSRPLPVSKPIFFFFKHKRELTEKLTLTLQGGFVQFPCKIVQ